MIRKLFFTLLALTALYLFSQSADAQCVMCKLNAENAAKEEGSGIGMGINSGIVYLMGIPYALLVVGAGVFFREKIFGFFKR